MKLMLLAFLILTAPFVNALNYDRCESEALALALQLDSLMQSSYDETGTQLGREVYLKTENSNFSNFTQYQWEVSFKHQSNEGAAWFNVYNFVFNEDRSGNCSIVSYRFYSDEDEGFLFEE